ncbi:MAG: hypothetical protein FJX72_11635, partial [Armatimonadetes bacterium]|nr:hypothetical protein [Armatimonadota bacterium]
MGARVLLCCSIIWFSTASNAAADRLPSRGFETGSDAAAEGWRPFEQGYRISRDPVRSGARALECANAAYDDRRGATATVELSQREPRPILVEGWSKARDVGGFRNNDYSIYLDLEHTDGTPLWGQTAPFSVGTHEWQRRRVLVFPTKPIKRVHVHALFRHHTGTAWFDDFTLRELDAGSTFDGQPLKPPAISRGTTYGWFVRDVAADGPIRSVTPAPVAGGTPALRSAATGAPTDAALKARLSQRSQSNGRLLAARIADTSGAARRLTVYYAERLPVGAQTWWTDMRRGVRCASVGEYANLTRIGVGATGMISLYPLACMTGPKLGRAIGVDPLSGPVVVRFGYHAASRLLYAAFDVALLPDNTRNSHAGRGHADLRIVRWDVDPAWGFRSACARYYAMFPEAFDRRARADGIWIPFTDPSSVRDVSDFGIAYHEGDNSIAGDDRLGILSFRYTEPMTWWMPMDPAMPRTYEAALDLVRRHLAGAQSGLRDLAQAVINSGSHDEGGRFNVEFQNAPWTNGAVWVLNPNPAMPRPNGQATKASLSYTPAMGDRMYGRLTGGTQDGEYLDSIEGWADVLDYRQESLRLSSVPATFETDAL